MHKTDGLTIQEATELFLVACEADGLRPTSVRFYVDRFKPFVAAFGSKALISVTSTQLRRYFADLQHRGQRWEGHPYIPSQEGGLAPDTVHGHFRAIRRFFNWCIEEHLIEENPVNGIRQKRPRNRIPKGISLDAFEAVFRETEGCGAWKARDRAMVLLLGDTGCRAGGLVNLDVGDVNLEERFVLLTEKGGKQRFSPISDVTADALARYIRIRPQIVKSASETALFISQRTKSRFTSNGVHQLIDRLGKRAGVKENVSLHRWRHAFARWYLMNGGDLSTLSDLMGHSNVEVTRDYYSVFNREELQRKHGQHSMVAVLSRNGGLGDGEE